MTESAKMPISSPVSSYKLQALSDERSQTLDLLLRRNHEELAPLLGPNLMFHNHLPHKLGCAYLFGFSAAEMMEMYDVEAAGNKYRKRSDPDFLHKTITQGDLGEHINQKKYSVSLTGFFDQQLSNGDWQEVLRQYLFGSPQLVNGIVGGLGHPLIHLAYALEFHNPLVAAEALSLACTERDPTHTLLPTFPPAATSPRKLRNILATVRADSRFDGLPAGYANLEGILRTARPALLEHWGAWAATDPRKDLEELLDLAVWLVMGTSAGGEYDFFFAHTLTAGHALRVLMPFVPEGWRGRVLGQFWMFILCVYVGQMRPTIAYQSHLDKKQDAKDDKEDDNDDNGDGGEEGGKDWEWVRQEAVRGDFAYDSHRLKVLRAFQVLEETFGQKGALYINAAVRFAGEFKGWMGFHGLA